MVWVKSRSPADNHQLIDTAQSSGSNAYHLNSNTTDASLLRTNSITGFLSSGFSVGATATVNDTSVNYASWTFRKAAKFFDVVTYTGNGVAGRQIAHSLGTTVGMIIVKTLNTPDQWRCYHRALGATKQIFLNLTNAASNSGLNAWNNTEPTSTDFTVGTDCNSNGATYVAYLFAHDTSSTGIIQCGSFTTDASGKATVDLGWEPQYILIKSSGGPQSWFLLDTMRGMSGSEASTINNRLYANTSAAEVIDSVCLPTSTGFKAVSSLVESTAHIYMAIRRPNKPPTTGTQVFGINTFSVLGGI
jgi:hypothetical protein